MNDLNPPVPAGLLSAGAFSRLSGLSRKALRVYEDTGLLPPHHIDPQNRYRFYLPDQQGPARIIQVLRMMDVSIEAISRLLQSQDPTTDLQDLWQQREKQHQQHQALNQYVLALLGQEGERPMFEVQQREVDGVLVATITGQVYQPEAPRFISESIQHIREELARQGVQAAEIDWTICHEGPTRDTRGTMEVCVPFEGQAVPTARVSLKFEPAHKAAFIRLRKGQCEPVTLMQAAAAGQQWLHENGHALVLGSREVYFADWSQVTDDEEAFDLSFPYQLLP